MSNINEKLCVALPIEVIEDVVGYLKELVKFVAYENTVYNPIYSSVDVHILSKKIEYFENILKDNELKFIPECEELEFEKDNN